MITILLDTSCAYRLFAVVAGPEASYEATRLVHSYPRFRQCLWLCHSLCPSSLFIQQTLPYLLLPTTKVIPGTAVQCGILPPRVVAVNLLALVYHLSGQFEL